MNRFALLLVVSLAALAAACGDSAPTSPSAAPATSSVAVTLTTDVIRVSETTQATATATTAVGPQPVTTGWRSDAPAVAVVTDSGMVTGTGPGRATISVISNGRQGSQVIAVNPNYQGQWQGTYTRRSCTQTGIFETTNLCGSVPTVLPTNLTLTQGRDTITGTFFFGTIPFPQFSAPIDGDGSVGFTATASGNPQIIAGWRVMATADGRLAGALTQIWRSATAAGEARIEADVTSVTRVSPTFAPASVRPAFVPATVEDAVRAISR